MKKTSKISKKGKGAPRRGEAPLFTRSPSTRGESFAPMKLSGMEDSQKQFNAEGFKK